jgi:CHAT domain-containing protein
VQIVTGDAFSDTGLEGRTDLSDYRIIHFATHGVVTSPAAKCPSQPALLTSFGGSGSDGWCSQAIGRSRTSMMRPSG